MPQKPKVDPQIQAVVEGLEERLQGYREQITLIRQQHNKIQNLTDTLLKDYQTKLKEEVERLGLSPEEVQRIEAETE